jgi:hypothetical protein
MDRHISHDDNESFDVGTIEINISYSITIWNNDDKYKGEYSDIYYEEDADKKYNELLEQYDNVVLKEIQQMYVVRKSKIKC